MILGGFISKQTATYTPAHRRDYGYCKDISNNPVAKRVLLFNQDTGRYLSSTVSRSSDGFWEIIGLPENTAQQSTTAIAIDDTNSYESVIRSHRSLKV